MKRIELELKEQGFKLVKTYDYDQYTIKVFTLGYLVLELVYEKDQLLDLFLSLEDIIHMPIEMTEIKQLIPVLGEKK